MIEPPCVVVTAPRPIAMVRLRVAWPEMRQVMRPGLAEVMAALAAQGIAPTGPWLNRHFRPPTDTLDFAICVPVASPVAPVGRVEPGMLPATTLARTVMHGDYAGLGVAWGELRAWIAGQGHATGPEFWECYTVGPESHPNAADWRTELSWPLAK